MFRCVLINKNGDDYTSTLTELSDDALPEGNVTVNIDYSSVNYKDALAITGRGPIVRQFPMVPGIDFAGTVEASAHADFRVGQKVLLTGWGVGEKYWGGLAGKARVNGDWLVPLPETADTWQVMAIGTAGFTAMLCVNAIRQHGVKPEDGPVLVTGANGGVGSCALLLLHALGYEVHAATGRVEETAEQLKALGAAEVISRSELDKPGKPLQKERWAAAVDTVGSHTLANVCASIQYDGVAAACGMAQGLDLPASVAPFILRGVTLRGIDSVMIGKEKRSQIWKQACELLSAEQLAKISHSEPLDNAISVAKALLDGKVKGRVVIDCRGQ